MDKELYDKVFNDAVHVELIARFLNDPEMIQAKQINATWKSEIDRLRAIRKRKMIQMDNDDSAPVWITVESLKDEKPIRKRFTIREYPALFLTEEMKLFQWSPYMHMPGTMRELKSFAGKFRLVSITTPYSTFKRFHKPAKVAKTNDISDVYLEAVRACIRQIIATIDGFFNVENVVVRCGPEELGREFLYQCVLKPIFEACPSSRYPKFNSLWLGNFEYTRNGGTACRYSVSDYFAVQGLV